jgi:predicted transcriptional regulator
MDGQKQVEFRKTRFSRPPSHVVVYASTPVKKVLGYFEVSEVDVAPVGDLWAKYAPIGGIGEADFFDYFEECPDGVAIAVGRVAALDCPMDLRVLGVVGGPPQNFAYLEEGVLDTLDQRATQRAVVEHGLRE